MNKKQTILDAISDEYFSRASSTLDVDITAGPAPDPYHIDDYAQNALGIALSDSEIRSIQVALAAWIKSVNSGDGEWSRYRDAAFESLND